MLSWTILFLVIALVAASAGFHWHRWRSSRYCQNFVHYIPGRIRRLTHIRSARRDIGPVKGSCWRFDPRQHELKIDLASVGENQSKCEYQVRIPPK